MGGNTSTSFGGGNQATGKLSSSFQPQYGQGYSPLPQQYQYGYNPAQQYQHYQPQPSYTPQHAALSNALANIPSFLQGSGVLQGNAAQQVQSVAQQAAQSAQPAPAAAPALNPAMSPMPMQLGSSGQNVPTMPTQMASYAANNFSPPTQLGSSGGQPPSAMPTQTEMRDVLAKAATSLASQQSSPMPMQLGSVGMGAFNAGAPTQTASMNSLGNRLASGSLRALNPPSQPSSLQSASISPEASVFRQFQNQQAGLPQTQAPVQAPPPGMQNVFEQFQNQQAGLPQTQEAISPALMPTQPQSYDRAEGNPRSMTGALFAAGGSVKDMSHEVLLELARRVLNGDR